MADTDQIVSVFGQADEQMHCLRCERLLKLADVALLIRVKPDTAFWPWCPNCAQTLMHWALAGLDADKIPAVIMTF